MYFFMKTYRITYGDSAKLSFENKKDIKQKKQAKYFACFFIGDLDRIQTCNLLSRNQMRYSVAPRGRF